MLALLLLLAAAPSTAPLTLTVTPRLALKPTDVHIILRLPRAPDNRVLVLVMDGPEYRASSRELDGADAPALIEHWFLAVRTPGSYLITALVRRKDGSERLVSSTFCLSGPGWSCSEGGG